MICPKCGTTNDSQATFCADCGSSFNVAPAVNVENPVIETTQVETTTTFETPVVNNIETPTASNDFSTAAQTSYETAAASNFETPITQQPNYNYQQSTSFEPVVEYAGFWRRFLAVVVDGIILAIPGIIIGFIVSAIFAGFISSQPDILSGINSEDYETSSAANSMIGLGSIAVALVIMAINGVIGLLYYSVMESSSKQATLGKMAIGIIVTDKDGKRLTFLRAVGRYLAKMIYMPFTIIPLLGILAYLAALVGYTMAGFTEKKQALHDMIAGTLVVKK